jgi:hypothetical protein
MRTKTEDKRELMGEGSADRIRCPFSEFPLVGFDRPWQQHAQVGGP